MDHAQISVQSSIKPSQAPGPKGLKRKNPPPKKKKGGRGKKKKKTKVRVKKDLGGAISPPPPDKDGPWGPCDPYATTSPKMVLDRGRP